MFRKLFSSTAFVNPGIQTIARYNQVPDHTPLLLAAKMAEGDAVTIDGDDILKRSSDIAAMVDYWDKTDALIEGYDAVRAAGEKYLPRFDDEKSNAYQTRLKLTKFTNVYRDIVEGLAAKPFEEEVSLKEDSTNAEIKTFIEDVDGQGNNLTVFASLTFFNGINSAIDWIFVDYPTVDKTVVRTLADQKEYGIKPFWSHVLGRNVLDVKTQNVGGKKTISYIKIFEPGAGAPDRVRIFQRDDAGKVYWELWEKLPTQTDGKAKFQRIDAGVLSIDVIPLVPFATGRRDGSTWKFFPAMQDAADLQVQLYQDESALKFIKTMAAYPMLAANGMRPDMEADGKTPKPVAIGPNVVLWGTPDGNGNSGEWKFIEPAATSMTFLQNDIKETKQDLRELGRQPLTATTGNLTVITTAVAAGKAQSAVQAWALGLKDALENALKITAKFLGITGYEPEVNVFTEFDAFAEGNTDLDALDKARARGDLSHKTFTSELKRRKVLSPEFDADEEAELILKEIPGDADLENEDDTTGNKSPKLPGNNRQQKKAAA